MAERLANTGGIVKYTDFTGWQDGDTVAPVGGMHYSGWQTFRAVCAFYEPVYYGRPMVI